MSEDGTQGEITDEAARPIFLIVDDSRLMRVAIKKMLKSECDLVEATDGEDAWHKLCAHHEIRGVFSDLLMPKLDGLGLLDRLRSSEDSRLKQIPFVLVTGKESDTNGLLEDVRQRGGNNVIGKPFNSRDVLNALHEMQAGRAPSAGQAPSPSQPAEAPVQQPAAADKIAEDARKQLEAIRESKRLAEEQAAKARASHEAALAEQNAAQEQARKAAEAQARRQAEEQARREAEEQARRQAEEQARRQAEEQARAEAAEQAKQRAAEWLRRTEQERAERAQRAQREAAQLAKQKAAEQARLQAESRAQKEAAEQAARAAAAAAKLKAEEEARRFGPGTAGMVRLLLPLLRLSGHLTGRPHRDTLADLHKRSRRGR